MKKLFLSLALSIALVGLVPLDADAQRVRPVRPRDPAAIEQKNHWVRQILSSAWTGVVGGALLFGLVSTGLVCYRWYNRIQRVKEPWELEPPKKEE